ncbi:MAG: RNA polymerase sigma factor [Kofleriaceae bacterium]
MEPRPERFRRLLEPVHDRTLAFARCLCKSRSDGDDLFQEAVLRSLAKLDGLRDDGAFRTWLYRIVVSVHRNRCRREFWRRLVPFGDPSPDDTVRTRTSGELDYRTTDWSPDAAAAADRARSALAALPAVQRESIVLFEIEGWQVDEIAALHGVSASAVKSRLARGRERMRAHYDREPVVGPTPVPAPGETR